MHTQVPRKVRHSGHRLAIAGAGLLGAAGLAVFAVGGATGAMAATPGTVTGGSGANTNQVTATVSVPAVTTLTLNSASLPFPTPATLPGTVASTLTGNASSNDGSGYTVSVASVSQTMTGGQTGAGDGLFDFLNPGGTQSNGDIPITDLSVQGGVNGTFSEAGTPVTTDTSGSPASNPISDAYSLNVPATTQAANYSAILAYTIAGN